MWIYLLIFIAFLLVIFCNFCSCNARVQSSDCKTFWSWLGKRGKKNLIWQDCSWCAPWQIKHQLSCVSLRLYLMLLLALWTPLGESTHTPKRCVESCFSCYKALERRHFPLRQIFLYIVYAEVPLIMKTKRESPFICCSVQTTTNNFL